MLRNCFASQVTFLLFEFMVMLASCAKVQIGTFGETKLLEDRDRPLDWDSSMSPMRNSPALVDLERDRVRDDYDDYDGLSSVSYNYSYDYNDDYFLGAASGTDAKATSSTSCLCTFDVDRTLTGKQSDTQKCSKNKKQDGIKDSAYGGGVLTLSEVGVSLEGSFCLAMKCYLGIITAGDASGAGSKERGILTQKLSSSLKLQGWSGPSAKGDHRAACTESMKVTQLVAGCQDGSKQNAAKAMAKALGVDEARVWHFDDRKDNVEPFGKTKMNAKQISCATRDGKVGLCGATLDEVKEQFTKVKTC